MVAATVAPRDTLDLRRQAGIALGYQVAEPVDVRGRFGRRLDLDPTANAGENFRRVERILGCRCHWPSLAVAKSGPCHAPASAGASIPPAQGIFADFTRFRRLGGPQSARPGRR